MRASIKFYLTKISPFVFPPHDHAASSWRTCNTYLCDNKLLLDNPSLKTRYLPNRQTGDNDQCFRYLPKNNVTCQKHTPTASWSSRFGVSFFHFQLPINFRKYQRLDVTSAICGNKWAEDIIVRRLSLVIMVLTILFLSSIQSPFIN